jgi:hypothetical protein
VFVCLSVSRLSAAVLFNTEGRNLGWPAHDNYATIMPSALVESH